MYIFILSNFISSEKTPAFNPEMERILSEEERTAAFRPVGIYLCKEFDKSCGGDCGAVFGRTVNYHFGNAVFQLVGNYFERLSKMNFLIKDW